MEQRQLSYLLLQFAFSFLLRSAKGLRRHVCLMKVNYWNSDTLKMFLRLKEVWPRFIELRLRLLSCFFWTLNCTFWACLITTVHYFNKNLRLQYVYRFWTCCKFRVGKFEGVLYCVLTMLHTLWLQMQTVRNGRILHWKPIFAMFLFQQAVHVISSTFITFWGVATYQMHIMIS